MSEHPAAALSLDSNHFHAQNINNAVHHTQTIGHQTQTIHQSQTFLPRRDPIDILRDHVASGALYNSKERYDPPKCHPQTRTAILQRIERWAASDSEVSEPIMWLRGPAGAGKSAIAQTLVEKWKKENLLILAFFFWRTSSERNQSTRLVPTLASELIGISPAIKDYVKAAIDTGEVFNTNLKSQLNKLVVEPLRRIAPSRPVVIVIDGLDECCIDLPKYKDFPGQSHESQQQEILEAFESACWEVPYLRPLIVSRPERQIRSSFGTKGLQALTVSLDLKDMQDASADIRLFLDCSFQEIRERHGIESSWPTKHQIYELVRKSSGQFIYPSIAVKHLTRSRENPKQSLIAVLSVQPKLVNNPLAELDMLYTLVLKSVAEASLPVVKDILGYLLPYRKGLYESRMLVSAIYRNGLREKSLSMFEKSIFLTEGEAEVHLDDLHSVLDIPPRTTHQPISFIHATFSEYLQDNSRSMSFFISKEQVTIRYTELLFRHLHEWYLHPEDQSYSASCLIDCTCLWIDNCPPLRSLMLHIWSLMGIDLGRYPLSRSHVDKESLLPASKRFSAQYYSKLVGVAGDYLRGDFLMYLQKCNIPEIEPLWLRRYLARRRLKAASKKISYQR